MKSDICNFFVKVFSKTNLFVWLSSYFRKSTTEKLFSIYIPIV